MLLDEIVEDEIGYGCDIDFEWREQAFDALVTFMAHHGHTEFTSEEFHRWASYYYNLDEPENNASWAHVFNKAFRRRMIRPIGSVINSKSVSVRRWVTV